MLLYAKRESGTLDPTTGVVSRRLLPASAANVGARVTAMLGTASVQPPVNGSPSTSLALGLPSCDAVLGGGYRTFKSVTTSARHTLLAMQST